MRQLAPLIGTFCQKSLNDSNRTLLVSEMLFTAKVHSDISPPLHRYEIVSLCGLSKVVTLSVLARYCLRVKNIFLIKFQVTFSQSRHRFTIKPVIKFLNLYIGLSKVAGLKLLLLHFQRSPSWEAYA